MDCPREAVKQPAKPKQIRHLQWFQPPAGRGLPSRKASTGTDKPRWSPGRKNDLFRFRPHWWFNVWGIHFDSTSGKPVGDEFRVTAF